MIESKFILHFFKDNMAVVLTSKTSCEFFFSLGWQQKISLILPVYILLIIIFASLFWLDPVTVPLTTSETLKHKINPSVDLAEPQTVHVLLYTPGTAGLSFFKFCSWYTGRFRMLFM